MFGVSLIALRQQLFELMQRTDARSEIEEVRDDVGRPANEPRHPLIVTGLPWPGDLPPLPRHSFSGSQHASYSRSYSTRKILFASASAL